jgi:DHA2 family multidrug resistance protein
MMPSILLATIVFTLDSTIAAVALPHMQGSFSATQEQVAWVLTSYIVASAVMTPLAGYLADRLGRRRVYLISISGFTVMSMLCGMAVNLEQMVLFRILQGALGAPLIPLAQATVLDSYPQEKYGRAMALFGMGVMLGPIIGPTLGGWLTQTYDWRWVFFINLPVGIIAFIGTRISVQDQDDVDRERPFDVAGFAYLSLAIASLQLMLDRGNSLGWFESTEVIAEALVAGVCFYLFLVQIFTKARPFVSPGLFRDRNFTVASVLGFVVGLNMLATMALLPPLLQNLLGYPVMDAGWLMAPRGVGTMISMLFVGQVVNRVDARILIFIGLSAMGLSLWEMSLFDHNVTPGLIAWTGFLQGFGMGFMFVPMNTLAFVTMEARFRTEATAIYTLLRNVGGSIGVSVLMGMLGVYYRTNRERLVTHINPFNPLLQDGAFSDVADIGSEQGRAVLNEIVNREALMLGYIDDFRAMVLLTVVSMLLLVALKPSTAKGMVGSG